MTVAQRTPTLMQSGLWARRVGFVVAIAINIVMLWVANNLLGWDVLPFLTADFGRLLWLIDLSLAATIAVNAFWVLYDPQWFRSLGQIGLNILSAVVAVNMYRVFPFDFSAYSFDWELVARAVIVLSIVGLALGSIVELTKVVRGESGFSSSATP